MVYCISKIINEGESMRNFKKILSVLLVSVMVLTSFGIIAYADDSETNKSGTLNVISYDLQSIRASLGEALFATADVAEIGAVLNALNYEIVATQEDYDVKWEDYPIPVETPDYHDIFVSQMKKYADIYKAGSDGLLGGVIDSILDTDPVALERHQTVSDGDGLGIYSTYALYDTDSQTWKTSEHTLADGSAQLYDTGFVVTTIELEEGYFLDIYNVSADENESKASVAARKAQFAQLAEYMKKHSVYDEEFNVYEHAVIVVGNLNASICQEETVYDYNGLVSNLIEDAGLNDAWAVTTIDYIDENPDSYDSYYDYALRTELTYDEAYGHYDSVERILYANGNGIDLSCLSFDYADIQGALGSSLSDHKAAVAQFSYEIVDKTYDYGNEDTDKVVEQEETWLIRFLNSIANIIKAIGYFFQNLFK